MTVKIDKRRKYVMVLDVETTGGLGNPLTYDLGFAVADKKGNVYAEKSFVISEIFDNEPLMAKAYYAEKIPQYKAEIESGKRTKVPFMTAYSELLSMMELYGCEMVAAYNLAFDRRALKSTIKYLYGECGELFPTNVKELCIWSLACEVLYTKPSFWKMAEKHNWFTPAGNMRTSAEIGHRYLTGEVDFEEEHTGLEDVHIEIQIMANCYKQRKQHESGVIAHPWRIPNFARNNQ